jgi:3-vinyl bacteriochlorophyllide hydratase
MAGTAFQTPRPSGATLYTPEQRQRRDASRWTLVQGILAPLQLLVCLVSAALVARYLSAGTGWELAAGSVVVKTALLYTIMITGALWEHDVYGQYLFAPAFFWEDVVSFVVLALHTAYLAGLAFALWSPTALATLALVAYAVYFINAAQFLWKLRLARRDARALGSEVTA